MVEDKKYILKSEKREISRVFPPFHLFLKRAKPGRSLRITRNANETKTNYFIESRPCKKKRERERAGFRQLVFFWKLAMVGSNMQTYRLVFILFVSCIMCTNRTKNVNSHQLCSYTYVYACIKIFDCPITFFTSICRYYKNNLLCPSIRI